MPTIQAKEPSRKITILKIINQRASKIWRRGDELWRNAVSRATKELKFEGVI